MFQWPPYFLLLFVFCCLFLLTGCRGGEPSFPGTRVICNNGPNALGGRETRVIVKEKYVKTFLMFVKGKFLLFTV